MEASVVNFRRAARTRSWFCSRRDKNSEEGTELIGDFGSSPDDEIDKSLAEADVLLGRDFGKREFGGKEVDCIFTTEHRTLSSTTLLAV